MRDLQHQIFYYPLNKSAPVCDFCLFKYLTNGREPSIQHTPDWCRGPVLLNTDSDELHTVWYTDLKNVERALTSHHPELKYCN